ncbi:MAG: phosphate ABC transporter permease subunit PstC, partial [Planctomycetes bacterium]|nr:phosphate ABC transporter permease subunit PstC [Planctomycetota bacterium]
MRLLKNPVSRLLLVMAFSAVSVLALITLFIFKEGIPLINKVGLLTFVLGTTWAPSDGQFGILPFIIGSLWVTLGALVLGAPLGLACALFIVEFAPKWLSRLLKPAVELLAGIPSVVYGFMGVVLLAPVIRGHFGGPGMSVLAASVILGIMILPTVIGISVDALQAVPRAYKEGSIALGATRWQTVWRVMLPAARSGLVAAAILGMGRAVGETMAVIMVAGNSIQVPRSLLDPTRTLTSNIALEMGYAMGDHRAALFATGIV